MLIDPNKWRELKIKQHVEALVFAHPSKMYTSDEMALNLIFCGKLTQLKQSYNVFSFTEQLLDGKPCIWHFNTCKPIVHSSLDQFHNWLALFHLQDQILLKKLENIAQIKGNSVMLAMKSQDYNKI